jgi:hypothetical protein
MCHIARRFVHVPVLLPEMVASVDLHIHADLWGNRSGWTSRLTPGDGVVDLIFVHRAPDKHQRRCLSPFWVPLEDMRKEFLDGSKSESFQKNSEHYIILRNDRLFVWIFYKLNVVDLKSVRDPPTTKLWAIVSPGKYHSNNWIFKSSPQKSSEKVNSWD